MQPNCLNLSNSEETEKCVADGLYVRPFERRGFVPATN